LSRLVARVVCDAFACPPPPPPPRHQAFAERGAEEGPGDDDIVTQIKTKRNMLGDLIAAKDVQVGFDFEVSS
jgi:hypothetical protein